MLLLCVPEELLGEFEVVLSRPKRFLCGLENGLVSNVEKRHDKRRYEEHDCYDDRSDRSNAKACLLRALRVAGGCARRSREPAWTAGTHGTASIGRGRHFGKSKERSAGQWR